MLKPIPMESNQHGGHGGEQHGNDPHLAGFDGASLILYPLPEFIGKFDQQDAVLMTMPASTNNADQDHDGRHRHAGDGVAEEDADHGK